MKEAPPHRVSPRWRTAAVALLAVNLLLVGLGRWLWHEELADLLTRPEDLPRRPPLERPDRLVLQPASHADLPGWGEAELEPAIAALRRSCAVWARQPADRPVGREGIAGTAGDWRPLCEEIVGRRADAAVLRAALVRHTRVWKVRNHEHETGLFTGYYEPLLRGSLRRRGEFRVPLHVQPRDLVSVDLGEFREDLVGRRIAGRLRGDSLVPYHDRASIAGGALAGMGLELVWVDDPVAAFFLQIQGSGRIRLDDGRELRLGYAAQNGHPYFAIGRELIDRGHLTRDEVSLQSIRAWLAEHPEQADEIMNTNASYVFFRRVDGEGPLGSMGVPLTPEASLAVDTRFLPLGAPLWLDTRFPTLGGRGDGVGETGGEPLRRLVVAQDTGGAIRGPVRGDVFWGHGERAEEIAGHMKSEGRLWLLLPAAVEPPREVGLPG